MKKILFNLILLTSSTSAVFAQNVSKLIINETPLQVNSEEELQNKEVAIAVSKAILKADWKSLDDLLASDYTYTGDGFVFTKDQYIGFMQEMRSAFSNFEMTLDKSIVNNDLVSIKFISRAVNTGKFMGAPATKKDLEVNGIFMRKVKDGKIMQEWQTTDLLGTMKQIGGGALFFYSIFVGGFNVDSEPPARLPNDFLNIEGNADKFDRMTAKEKKKYVKKYKKELEKKTK